MNLINYGNAEIAERTKLAAYYLFQYTGYENTLALWYCAEDIASFFARCGLLTDESVARVISSDRDGREYKSFVRHISYRLHLYTGILDDVYNWHTAEHLLASREWRGAIIFLAQNRGNSRDTDF
jgi:hypothetical protein